jgi:hypothetical protein
MNPQSKDQPTETGKNLYFCNKCGYSGIWVQHDGCNYFAYKLPQSTDTEGKSPNETGNTEVSMLANMTGSNLALGNMT